MMKLKILLSTLFLLMVFTLISQSHKSGAVSLTTSYIPEGGNMAIFADYNFAASHPSNKPSIIYTNRSMNPGIVNFGPKSQWHDADDQHYVDGYVSVHHNREFTFPIGDQGHFKPLTIEGSEGFTAAYYNDNPENNALVNTVINNKNFSEKNNLIISNNEYWHISGKNATRITIPWNKTNPLSNQISVSNNTDNLCLVAWNGNDWVILESIVNTEFDEYKSAISSGSVSTVEAIIPDDYKIITFGIIDSSEQFDQSEEALTTHLNLTDLIEFTVFPNPVTDLTQVNLDYKLNHLDNHPQLVIYDALGQLIYSEYLNSTSEIISFNNLVDNTSQVYHVGIVTNNGFKKFETIIVNRK